MLNIKLIYGKISYIIYNGDVRMEIYKISENMLQTISFLDLTIEQGQRYWIIGEPEEILRHNDFFNFHKSTLEECSNNKQHPRLEVYDDVSFGVINIIDHAGNWLEAKEIDFYITRNYLIFVSKGKNKLFEQIKNEILQNVHNSPNYSINESKILYMLLPMA